jgi:hypothetical protein
MKTVSVLCSRYCGVGVVDIAPPRLHPRRPDLFQS